MAKDFYADEVSAINKWIYERDLYHRQVRTHFNDNKKFMIIDVTRSNEWIDELISFFDGNELKYTFEEPIKAIHKNKRNRNELLNKKLLAKYFGIVDRLI